MKDSNKISSKREEIFLSFNLGFQLYFNECNFFCQQITLVDIAVFFQTCWKVLVGILARECYDGLVNNLKRELAMGTSLLRK